MKAGWDTEKLRDLCRHIGSPLAVTADDVLGRIQTSRVREVRFDVWHELSRRGWTADDIAKQFHCWPQEVRKVVGDD